MVGQRTIFVSGMQDPGSGIRDPILVAGVNVFLASVEMRLTGIVPALAAGEAEIYFPGPVANVRNIVALLRDSKGS